MGERLMAAVLAGGEGRRMGGVKALRPFRGRPLAAHAADLARRWTAEVAVVVRDEAQLAGALDAPLVLDRADLPGPLGGLAAALAHAQAGGADLLITLPCDMPELPVDLPARLARGLEGAARVAIPEVAGQLEPACGLWRPAALEALPGYLASGRSALQGFARAAGLAAVAFGQDEAQAFADADTVEALAALERRGRTLPGPGSSA
jgi:molybdopterin-guanine dinucleotide biosynthesis protein A